MVDRARKYPPAQWNAGATGAQDPQRRVARRRGSLTAPLNDPAWLRPPSAATIIIPAMRCRLEATRAA